MMQVDLGGDPCSKPGGPSLHYWGRHIRTDRSMIYASKKSYFIRAYIKVCYASPLLLLVLE